MNLEDIIAGLRALSAWDFDYSNPAMNGPEQLDLLTDCLLDLPERQSAVAELFGVMERMPESDLGTPGPLVYTLEQLDYEAELIDSVRRVPTVLSVTMVSRLLRKEIPTEKREILLDLLAQVPGHAQATYSTREDAKHFLRVYGRGKAQSV